MILCFLFGHGHTRRERDTRGVLVLICERCEQVIPANQSEIVKGPRHSYEQVKVVGEPTGQAKIVRADNVTEFKMSQR